MTSVSQIDITLGNVLAHLGCGIALLDDVGRTVFANVGGAERLAQIQTEPGQTTGSRPAVGEGERRTRDELRAHLRLLLTSPNFGREVSRPFVIERYADGGRTVAYAFAPIQDVSEQRADVRVAVVFLEHSTRRPLDPDAARHILNLTLGEARLACHVAAGLSPRDAAASLGTTTGSARTTLKRVFAKAGVSRQGDLAVLLARLTFREPDIMPPRRSAS